MLKWILFVVASCLLATPLFAAVRVSDVAKVYSKVCDHADADLKGSGLAFRHHGKVYVLTSEHVVLASNDTEFCHSVSFGQAEYNAKILSLNWWKGVALLELDEENVSEELAEFSEILADYSAAQSVQVGDSVSMIGFPYENTSVFLDKDATVSTNEGQRSLIPGVDITYEVKGVVEWGMSGGPMISDGVMQGVISHQYLQKVEGGTSYVEVFGKDTITLANHLVIIPFASVLPWLVDSLELDTPDLVSSGVRKDPQAQLAGMDVIYVKNIKLTMIPGFGGGDGTGTGGKKAKPKLPRDSEAGVLVIEYDQSQSDLDVQDLPPGVSKWATDLQDRVLRRKKGQVRKVVVDRKLHDFYSVAGFFHRLHQKGGFANAEWEIEGAETSGIGKIADEALPLLDLFDEKLQADLSGKLKTHREVNEANGLLAELRNVFDSINVGGQIVYRVDELQALKKNDKVWNSLIAIDFDLAVKLRMKLEAVINTALKEQL